MSRVFRHQFSRDGYGNAAPLAEVVIHGQSTRTVNLTGLWDTGSSLTLVHIAYAKSLGYVDHSQLPRKSIAGIGGNIDAVVVCVPRLVIGGMVEIREVEIGFAPMGPQFRYQMLLGQNGVLSRIWLTHNSKGNGAGFFSFGLRLSH